MYTHTKIFYFTLVTFNVLCSYEAATVPDKAAAMSVDAEGRTVMYKKPRKEEKQDGDIGAEDGDTGVKDEDTGSGSAALAEVAADSGESEETTHGQETDATEESSPGAVGMYGTNAVLGNKIFGDRVKFRRTTPKPVRMAAKDQRPGNADSRLVGETQGVQITINTGTARGIDAEVEAAVIRLKCVEPQCRCKAYYTEENKEWYAEPGLTSSKPQACKLEKIEDSRRKESSLPELSNEKCIPTAAILTEAETFDTAAKYFLGAENTCDAYAQPTMGGRPLGWAYGASIRNYYQVVNADIVIAVSYLTGGKPPWYGLKGQVTSGTGMAVEFWRLKGKSGSAMYLYIDSRVIRPTKANPKIPDLGEVSYLGETANSTKAPLDLYRWYEVSWNEQNKKSRELTVYDLIKAKKGKTSIDLKTLIPEKFGNREHIETAVIGHDTPTRNAKIALNNVMSSILKIR